MLSGIYSVGNLEATVIIFGALRLLIVHWERNSVVGGLSGDLKAVNM